MLHLTRFRVAVIAQAFRSPGETMKTSFDLRPTLDFLGRLKLNNNKVWFDQHRADYQEATTNFEAFIDGFINEFRGVEDFGDISARDCMFRINRDIRFSRDKSPYKPYLSAHIVRGGRRSGNLGYYFQLAPDGESFLAGGLYNPTAQELANVRHAIARDASPLRRIVKNPRFVRYYGTVSGERVKTAPQGYARDHPAIEFLKMKQIVAMHRIPDHQICASNFLPYTVQACRALKPLLDYLNVAIK